MAAFPGACGRKGGNSRPASFALIVFRKPAAQRQHRFRNLAMGPAAAMPFEERRRGLPERTGLNLHREPLDSAAWIELDRKDDAATASRRTKLCAPILSFQLARLAERPKTPATFAHALAELRTPVGNSSGP